MSATSQRLQAEDIYRLGATNVADAIKHLSGVTVKDYGGVGGIKSVAIRGMGTQHTAVFYDGVAVGDCQSGQVDLGRFSTDNLDGLQLTIGQDDDIYRSARMLASAGALFLDTRMLEGNDVKVTARAGMFDTYQANLLLCRDLGKGWNLSLFGDYTTTCGDYEFSIRSARKNIEGRRLNSDIECGRAEANLSWSSGDRHRLRAKLYGYLSERGVPGAVIVDNPLSSERLLSRNMFAQLFYEYVPLSALRMKVALKHNYTFDRYRQPVLGNEKSTDEYNQHETDFSYTVKWVPSFARGLSFSWSEELFHNRLNTTNSHTVMSSVPRRLTLLSAVSARYSSRYICVTASLLHTYADERASKGDVAPDRRHFSPSFSLSFYPFGEQFIMRASYKDIFRMATFNDLYYRETGNYLLSPEKSRMFNVGAAYSFPKSALFESLYVSLDGYWGRVEDKIVAVPGIFVWKMSNVDDVALSGVDANIDATVALGKGTQLDASLSYSYMRAVDDTSGSLVNGNQIVYTPLHSGSASISFINCIADVGYSLVWSGERYRLPQNIKSNKVDAYADHSFWISRKWELAAFALTSKFEALNVIGDNYEIIRYYPMPGRSFRLSAVIDF